MINELIIQGEWFFPKEENYKSDGILSYMPNEDITLEITHKSIDFSSNYNLEKTDIILGFSNDGKLITLYNCREICKDFTKTKYNIKLIVLNAHLNSIDELKFNIISAEIYNLDDWINVSGFKKSPISHWPKSILIDYEPPKNIEFEIDENTKGIFSYSVNIPELSQHQKSITVNQTVCFQAVSEYERDILDLIKYVEKFQNFLTLALYRNTYVLKISLERYNYKLQLKNEEGIPRKAELIYFQRNIKEHKRTLFASEMIFDYNLIKYNFKKIILNWFAKYETLKPAIELVIEQFYKGNKFTTNTFLNLAQAAETFHSRIHSGTKIPKEDYSKITSDILGIVPIKYKTLFREQLNFANNLNLHSRLTELTEKYSNKTLNKILEDIPNFVKNVKYSRNYYTHYSNDSKKKALKGRNLFILSEKLKLLLTCAFLIEIGIEENIISENLNSIKWECFNHLDNK